MHVTLSGSSPATATAGIMLLTRARQLGYPVSVAILGNAADAIRITGAAICYAPVLASCGVGREDGSGATVVVPGAPGSRLLATVHPHGESGWFSVDRSGEGAHPAAQAYVELCRDAHPLARRCSRTLRKAMEVLGLSRDPAIMDILFGADVAPLTRLAVGLRAGRALSKDRGQPITRFLTGGVDRDPLPAEYPGDEEAQTHTENLSWILDGLSPSIRDGVESFLLDLQTLTQENPPYLALTYHLAELASQLTQLPARSILPPLGAAEDSVATGMTAALSAHGDGDANRQLLQTFTFLGGRFVDEADNAVNLGEPPPDGGQVETWEWFCAQVRLGRKSADALWPDVVDPPS